MELCILMNWPIGTKAPSVPFKWISEFVPDFIVLMQSDSQDGIAVALGPDVIQ